MRPRATLGNWIRLGVLTLPLLSLKGGAAWASPGSASFSLALEESDAARLVLDLAFPESEIDIRRQFQAFRAAWFERTKPSEARTTPSLRDCDWRQTFEANSRQVVVEGECWIHWTNQGPWSKEALLDLEPLMRALSASGFAYMEGLVDLPSASRTEVALWNQEASSAQTIPPLTRSPSPEVRSYRLKLDKNHPSSLRLRARLEGGHLFLIGLAHGLSLLLPIGAAGWMRRGRGSKPREPRPLPELAAHVWSQWSLAVIAFKPALDRALLWNAPEFRLLNTFLDGLRLHGTAVFLLCPTLTILICRALLGPNPRGGDRLEQILEALERILFFWILQSTAFLFCTILEVRAARELWDVPAPEAFKIYLVLALLGALGVHGLRDSNDSSPANSGQSKGSGVLRAGVLCFLALTLLWTALILVPYLPIPALQFLAPTIERLIIVRGTLFFMVQILGSLFWGATILLLMPGIGLIVLASWRFGLETRTRPLLRWLLAGVLVGNLGIGPWLAALELAHAVKVVILEREISALRPVLDALELYRAKQGHLPASLGDLVPGYLASEPRTRLLGFPDIWYSAELTPSRGFTLTLNLRGKNWLLGRDDVEVLFFRSDGRYPLRMSNGKVIRIGAWGYRYRTNYILED